MSTTSSSLGHQCGTRMVANMCWTFALVIPLEYETIQALATAVWFRTCSDRAEQTDRSFCLSYLFLSPFPRSSCPRTASHVHYKLVVSSTPSSLPSPSLPFVPSPRPPSPSTPLYCSHLPDDTPRWPTSSHSFHPHSLHNVSSFVSTISCINSYRKINPARSLAFLGDHRVC